MQLTVRGVAVVLRATHALARPGGGQLLRRTALRLARRLAAPVQRAGLSLAARRLALPGAWRLCARRALVAASRLPLLLAARNCRLAPARGQRQGLGGGEGGEAVAVVPRREVSDAKGGLKNNMERI